MRCWVAVGDPYFYPAGRERGIGGGRAGDFPVRPRYLGLLNNNIVIVAPAAVSWRRVKQ